jgi:hypothetical protein
MSLRSQLRERLNDFDVTNLDKLETYALALTQAHSVCCGVEDKSPELQRLSGEAQALRERLLGDLLVLVKRGFVSSATLKGLRGPNGHRNIASDILVIANVLRSAWTGIAGKTAVTEDELLHAEALGDAMLAIVGKRNQFTALGIQSSEERQRAYTLFMRAYNEVRSAITYLRRNCGDADSIAPSVYRRRNPRRKQVAEQAREDSELVTSTSVRRVASTCDESRAATDWRQCTAGASGVAPVPGVESFDSGMHDIPGARSTAPGTTSTSNEARAGIKVGMPGADPFVH